MLKRQLSLRWLPRATPAAMVRAHHKLGNKGIRRNQVFWQVYFSNAAYLEQH